jgi:hypothetical protein
MLRSFTQALAKDRPGAIAQYIVPGLKARNSQPGRNTVGQKIDQMMAEFHGMFKDHEAGT